jgi:hypothetical protein
VITKSDNNSIGIARKTLALATALSLVSFGFAGIGTGAALGSPASDAAITSANTTEVIKLANGKTRIKVDLADSLRGKTITIKTTRMVNGKRVKVTLGKIKLTKTGQGKLTVSRKIRVDDTLVVSDGVTNIVRSKVQVIDDRRIASTPAPVPPPSGGGSSGVSTTFTVTVSDEVGPQPIVFGGNATGDITVTLNQNAMVVFTRGGVSATTILDANADYFINIIIPNPVSGSLIISADDFTSLPLSDTPNVKIAGTATAAALLGVYWELVGSQIDATLVTKIVGSLSDVLQVASLGRPNLSDEIEMQFGSTNTAIELNDFDQSKKLAWSGPSTFDNLSSPGDNGKWSFDSDTDKMYDYLGDSVLENELSGLGNIISVTGTSDEV